MIYSRSGLKRERSCTSMATVGMFYKVGQRGVKMIRDYEGKLIDKSLRNKLIGGFSLEKQRSQSKSVGKIYYPRVVIKENVGGARKELYEF